MKTILLFLSVLLLPFPAWGAGVIRYVDLTIPAGDCVGTYSISSRNCTGSAIAYNTLNEGLAATAAGDILRLRPGTYTTPINSSQYPSGTATNPTTIEACPVSVCGDTALTAIIRPTTGTSLYASAIDIEIKNYIVIRGLSVDSTVLDGRAIVMSKTLNNILIENNAVTSSRSCITATNFQGETKDRLTIRGNRVGPCGNPILQGSEPSFTGIYLRSATNHVIERNTIDAIYGWCIRTDRADVSAVFSHNGTIRFNSCSRGRAGIQAGGGINGVVFGNVIYNNRHQFQTDGTPTTEPALRLGLGNPDGWVVANNTMYNNADVCLAINSNADNAIVINNLCLSNDSNIIDDDGAGNTKTNNRFTMVITEVMDAANARFTPREGANLLIGQGTTTGLPTGYTCIVTCDIGALQAPKFSHGSIENGDASSIRWNWILASQGVRSGVGISASNCDYRNFAITVAGSGASENSCGTTGDRQTKIGVAGAVTVGQTVTGLYTRSATLANNLQDNTCIGGDIGGCKNAEIRTTTTIPACPTSAPSCFTNNVSASIAAVLSSINHRWFHVGDGSIASPKWRGQLNGSGAVMYGGYTGVVMGIDCTAGNCNPVGFQLYFACTTAISAFCKANGGTYVPLTDDATTNMLAFGAFPVSQVHDGETISSALITDPHGSFVAGKVVGKQATNPTVDLTQNSTTQLLALVKTAPTAPVGEQFCLQARTVDGTAITQTDFPCVTVAAPAAGFGF